VFLLANHGGALDLIIPYVNQRLKPVKVRISISLPQLVLEPFCKTKFTKDPRYPQISQEFYYGVYNQYELFICLDLMVKIEK
jgi:hypothetical protein